MNFTALDQRYNALYTKVSKDEIVKITSDQLRGVDKVCYYALRCDKIRDIKKLGGQAHDDKKLR